MRRDEVRGWCALCRRAGIAVVAAGAVFAVGPATSARPAPAAVRVAVAPPGTGLSWPGWTLPDRAEQGRELVVLQQREQARRTAPAAAVPAGPAATRPPAGPRTDAVFGPSSAVGAPLGSGTAVAAPQAVSVAIRFALAQLGKPYVWGATGPDTYDCSGLVQTSYAAAGVALPRTSRQQARVGTPVALPDLLPGDLVFWAYDPGDLGTVHHVAMYLGDGKVVQSPQSGETVKVSTLWLSGYAGAVRVAAGPADTPLPTTPTPVPGTGLTPSGDEGLPDGPPVPVRRLPAPDRAAPLPGTPAGTPPRTLPGTKPGTPPPGTTTPGTTAPATPGGMSPGTAEPAPGPTAPGTTAPSAPGPTAPGTPDATSPGTNPPGTAPPTTPAPTTPAPTTPAPTAPAPTAPAATTAAPATTPPSATAPRPTPPPTTPPPPAGTAPESTTPAPTAAP